MALTGELTFPGSVTLVSQCQNAKTCTKEIKPAGTVEHH